MQHERLGHLLPIVPLPHLRQNHEALLALLDETVKRVVAERIVLHPLTNPTHLHQQGRVADSALQQNLDQLAQEGLYLVEGLIAISAADTQSVDDRQCLILQLFLLGYLRGNPEMACLERLAQDIHHRPLQRVQTAHFTQRLISRGKMRVDESCCCLEGLQVEVDNTLESEFFGAEQVEELIEAVALVEFCDFAGEFVAHGEIGGGIVEPCDHMAQIVLQGEHLRLQPLVLLDQSLLLLFHVGQLANQQLHLPAQVPGLR